MIIYVKKAHTFLEKSFGLIGKKRPYPLLIKTRFGIHTFGVTFPLDIVILDSGNTVVNVKENLRPCRFFFWNPAFNTVIEFPLGTIKNKGIKKGGIVKVIEQLKDRE